MSGRGVYGMTIPISLFLLMLSDLKTVPTLISKSTVVCGARSLGYPTNFRRTVRAM
jgi:hypothetical protein